MEYEFTVVIERDEDGVYFATTSALQGCHSWGDTADEALENVKDAIRLHIESRREPGEPIPHEVTASKDTHTYWKRVDQERSGHENQGAGIRG